MAAMWRGEVRMFVARLWYAGDIGRFIGSTK